MTDDERAAPDSLGAKVRDFFRTDDHDDHASDGSTKLDTDAGMHLPTSADEPEPTGPKRPTDPPF